MCLGDLLDVWFFQTVHIVNLEPVTLADWGSHLLKPSKPVVGKRGVGEEACAGGIGQNWAQVPALPLRQGTWDQYLLQASASLSVREDYPVHVLFSKCESSMIPAFWKTHGKMCFTLLVQSMAAMGPSLRSTHCIVEAIYITAMIFILTVLTSFPSQEGKMMFGWLQTGRP